MRPHPDILRLEMRGDGHLARETERWSYHAVDSLSDYGVDISKEEAEIQAQFLELSAMEELAFGE